MILARCAAWLAALALPIAALGAFKVSDDSGRVVVLQHPPARIVSFSPGAAEMLFAAGAGRLLVATVEYSDEPTAARAVPRIGDAAAIDMERLVALKPDVVLVWPGGGNPASVAQLERLGIPVYRQQVDTFADFPGSLRRLGKLAGTEPAADRAAGALEQRLARLARRYRDSESPSVLLEVWNRPVYTVGGAHLMTDALHLCGARNAFGDLREPGPVIEVESVIARNPDIIIAVSPPGSAASWLDEWRRFGSLKAVRTGRLIPFEDQRLSRLGPSALDATEALCRLIDAKRSVRLGDASSR